MSSDQKTTYRTIDDGKNKRSSIAPQVVVRYERYWKTITDHQFVLAPHGNGQDTHRLWEVLALGAVPVVLPFLPLTPPTSVVFR